MSIRRWLTISAASISLVGAMPGHAPAAPTVHAASVACKGATIAGAPKCIARGRFCARAQASDYRRYGLSCTNRDANGRYHQR